MRKGWGIFLLTLIFLVSSLSSAVAGKPGGEIRLNVSSTSDTNSITLHYKLENSRKVPDKYIVKRDSILIYQGSSTSFSDYGLLSGTSFTYTVEAWLNGKILSSTYYLAATNPIYVAPIIVTKTLNLDFSTDVHFEMVSKPSLTPDFYTIYINNSLDPLYVVGGDQSTIHIPSLLPSKYYTIRVEAYNQNQQIGEGSTTFIAPYQIESIYSFPNYETRIANIDFKYDQVFQSPDLMVITRNSMTLVNNIPTQDPNSIVIYQGIPLTTITERDFEDGIIRFNYSIANYRNGDLIGVGKVSVPNVFDY